MLEYRLDLLPESHTRVYAPDVTAKSFPFYVTEAGYFLAGRDYFTRRDGKAGQLLLWTTSGGGSLTWKERTAALEPGSLALIDCETLHDYRTRGETWGFYFAHFDGAGIAGFSGALLERLTVVRPRSAEAIGLRFQELMEQEAPVDVLACAVMSQALSALLLMMLSALRGEMQAEQHHRDEVKQVSDYILGHLDEPLSTEDFARVANLSKYHLIRLFRQQMGVPPHRYMQQCRVNRAMELLRTSDAPIGEIGAQVGMPDTVNFIRLFRTLAGTTPARYRKESLEMP